MIEMSNIRCLRRPPSYIPKYMLEDWHFFGLSERNYARALRIWDWVKEEQGQGRQLTVDFCDVIESVHADVMKEALIQTCSKRAQKPKGKLNGLWGKIWRA